MKKILITGAKSYIGESVKDYLAKWKDEYTVVVKDAIGWDPEISDFEGFDVVFNVAGIVHIKETISNRQLYFDVNRDLVVKIAKTAKEAGVKQFILLSSMSVYGVIVGHIKKDTLPKPTTAYGESKLQADIEIEKLQDESFIFSCLRPPMVYGKNCPGNYQMLRKIAIKSPLFPKITNERSMVYIGNLCEFIKSVIDQEKRGLFFPQNEVYINTSNMVEKISAEHNRKILFTPIFNLIIKLLPITIMKKVFGNLTYEKVDQINNYSFEESIYLSERG